VRETAPAISAMNDWRRDLKIDDGSTSFRIVVHGHGVEIGDELRAFIEASVWKDLRPFAARIIVSHVRLWHPAEAEAPAVCQVRVDLRPSGGLALGETAGTPSTAVEKATRRMGRALGRQLGREDGSRPQAWLR
jgi:ribosome-associated translation inhibitor RaiA